MVSQSPPEGRGRLSTLRRAKGPWTPTPSFPGVAWNRIKGAAVKAQHQQMDRKWSPYVAHMQIIRWLGKALSHSWSWRPPTPQARICEPFCDGGGRLRHPGRIWGSGAAAKYAIGQDSNASDLFLPLQSFDSRPPYFESMKHSTQIRAANQERVPTHGELQCIQSPCWYQALTAAPLIWIIRPSEEGKDPITFQQNVL